MCIFKVTLFYIIVIISKINLGYFYYISLNPNRGVVTLFIFLEKTKQKIVLILESLRLQGRSSRQAHFV